MFSPDQHDDIWKIQKPLDFPRTVFGVERPPSGHTAMPKVMPRYSASLGRHHDGDRIITPPKVEPGDP